MSDHSNTQLYADYHDNDQKCMSLGDDNVDSGIGSITLSEIENHQQVLHKIDETDDLQKQFTTEVENQRKEIDDEERIESDSYGSMTQSDELCDSFIPNESGFSQLHLAICDRNTEQAIDLIQKCPDSTLLNYFTKSIHTSLHLAVYSNSPQIVRFLIVYGADLNFKDKKGNTPLHTACQQGTLSCVRMLLTPLDKIENIGLQETKIPQDINEKNYEGYTPLHLATIYMQTEVVNFLLQQPQINLNIGDSTAGRTALHHAIERHHIQCFYALLKKSANVNAITYDGCSPLHLAVGYELEKETRSLVSRGANAYLATGGNTRACDLARTPKLKDALQFSMTQMQNKTIKQR